MQKYNYMYIVKMVLCLRDYMLTKRYFVNIPPSVFKMIYNMECSVEIYFLKKLIRIINVKHNKSDKSNKSEKQDNSFFDF